MKKLGKGTLQFSEMPCIVNGAAVVGKLEGEGPLQNEFDRIYQEDTLAEKTFEQAESKLQKDAVSLVLQKSELTLDDIDFVFGGDLLNQCIATSFAAREWKRPLICAYGACSTMTLSLALACVFLHTGAAKQVIAETSSHFCAAERQFRLPLEYGGQRTPTAQRTATAAGATLLCEAGKPGCAKIAAVTFGEVVDLQIHDSNNMGAAMAPAAAKTIAQFLKDMHTAPTEYDLILTGDLGAVGSALLYEILETEYAIDIRSRHQDCGLLLFDREKQDVHAGGSGCGCAASVFNSYILHKLENGTLSSVLFVATGALLSPTSSMQGESIPGIAHAVLVLGPERIK